MAKTKFVKESGGVRWKRISLIISVIVMLTVILTWLGLNPASYFDKKTKDKKDTVFVKPFQDIRKESSIPSVQKKEKNITVENISGDVVISNNQKNGITAHTVNVNSTIHVNELTEPDINYLPLIKDKYEDSLYVTKGIIKILSSQSIPMLSIIFRCSSIIDVSIQPTGGHAFFSFSDILRDDGYKEILIKDAVRSYYLTIKKNDKLPSNMEMRIGDNLGNVKWSYQIIE